MAVYIEKFDGYIADVPNIVFERCDGKVFAYDEVNTASMSNTANSLSITGGQGNYPLAFIETDKTLEFTFASSKFTMEMFEMANNVDATDDDRGILESKKYAVEADLKITLPFEVKENSVGIRGLEEAAAVAAGKFKVAITTSAADTAGETVITFNTGDVAVGDEIRVSYRRRVVAAHGVDALAAGGSARGALGAEWPVYSDGTDCTESAKKGILHLWIYRVRATALPGFDTSYKQGATNSITFSAIDPKRADGRTYSLFYEPLDADGNIVNKSSDATVDW